MSSPSKRPLSDVGGVTSPKPRKKQRTIDYVGMDLKETVNQGGLWQMDTKRRSQIDNQRSKFVGTLKPKSTDIRITSSTSINQTWGNSADENVRTQLQRDQRKSMSKHEAETVFNQRSQQSALIWTTGSKTLQKYGEDTDTSEPISGHTPGVKHSTVGGTKGAMTKEHGRRDILRQSIVKQTLDDPKRGEHDVAIMSKLATIQLFQSPKEELQTRRSEVLSSSKPIYSQFEDIGQISGKKNSGNFDKLTDRLQVIRETDKMHAAKALLVRGFDSLVPESHKTLLDMSKGDVPKAMKQLHQESISSKPNIEFNTSKHSQTTRLNRRGRSLTQMGKRKSSRDRPLSPVRGISSSKFDF